MSHVPRVSVVIPAYQSERFLRGTLDSVLAQTLADLEVVVVDDGSTDGTAAIARGYGPPVRLLAGRRRGVSAARNAGIAASTAGLIAFLDHDDRWGPDKLERQATAMEREPQAGLCFTRARVVEGGRTVEVFPDIREPDRLLARAYEELVHWNYIPMSAVMVRRSALEEAGTFDTDLHLAEDWDLWLRIARRRPLLFLAETLTEYRIVAGRATARMADLRLEDLRVFQAQLRARPGLRSSDPRRCAATLMRLRREAAYWLLREGRRREARAQLWAAWRARPLAAGALLRLAAALGPSRPAPAGPG